MRRQLEEREGTGVARDRKERNAGGRKRERAIERACNAQIYVCPLKRGGKERYMGGERKREDEGGGGDCTSHSSHRRDIIREKKITRRRKILLPQSEVHRPWCDSHEEYATISRAYNPSSSPYKLQITD